MRSTKETSLPSCPDSDCALPLPPATLMLPAMPARLLTCLSSLNPRPQRRGPRRQLDSAPPLPPAGQCAASGRRPPAQGLAQAIGGGAMYQVDVCQDVHLGASINEHCQMRITAITHAALHVSTWVHLRPLASLLHDIRQLLVTGLLGCLREQCQIHHSECQPLHCCHAHTHCSWCCSADHAPC